MLNKPESMRIFVRVAELASFTQAADSLGLPKASISTAVQQLERQLGTQLLHRTTRKVQMTQDGMAFYERCKDLLADMEDLETMFQRGSADISGRLRVDMPTGVAKNIIVPHLPEFLQAYPNLEVELSSTDRRVDIVREGFDCVLRVGTLSDSALIARPLGRFKQLNCASPGYLARYGTPQTLDDLANHRLIHYVPILGGKSDGWEFYDGQQCRYFAMPGALTVNNSEAYQVACLAGLGLIQAPGPGIRQHIAERRLVEVMPEYRAEAMPVSLIYANRRHLAKRVQLFMNWVAETMQPFLEPLKA